MSDLNFDLDNFDLEPIEVSTSNNNDMSKPKSRSISELFSKPTSDTSRSISITKSPSMDNLMSSLEKNETSSNTDFGLDMLVNKQKVRKDSPPPNTSNSPPPPTTTVNKQDSKGNGLFSNLFGSKKDEPASISINKSDNNINKPSSSFSSSFKPSSIDDIDIDRDLENLGRDLDKGMEKIKSMSGPGLPDFGSSSTPPPITSNDTNTGYIPGESINMTYEEIQKAKFDLLCKFERLRDKGVKIPKVFSMSSDYEEMKYEYERLLHQKKMDNSVKMQRRMLISFISGAEWLNGRFDPFDLKLDGWSESIHDGIDEYDDVFEELYEKYQGSGSMSPELRLCLMVGGSAFMFHLQNSMLKSSMPSADQVFRNNPNLAKQFADAAKNEMGNPGFAGFMGGSNGGQQDGPPLFDAAGQQGGVPDLDSILKNL